ncbi:MAG: glycosyl transferase, partial [Cytophagia bacterium]|nr:glycosyl transferase [Cytophagia bacterium]
MASHEESESKRVMVITYYWPPSGGSGVQRWLKFVKYLPQYGWQPYVFTPENPAFDLKDESLLKDIPSEAEVLHFPIWEPYGLFNKLSGGGVKVNANSAPQADSWFKKISIWIRGNFFIPDPRVFWVRPSVNFLDDFLREKRIRHIITTGPPHSVHLIGLGLKKRNPSLKWTADFRDPWSEWGFLDTLKLSKLARKRHQQLEKKVL